MSAPPFRLLQTREFAAQFDALEQRGETRIKARKVRETMRQLVAYGPSYPGLGSHLCESLSGPDGERLWGSYLENHPPAAWRLWWCYGAGEDTITLVTVGPHLD